MIKATERILRFFLTAVGMAGFCLFLLPQTAGCTPRVVISGSMEPAVPVGSIVYTNRWIKQENIKEGDIIEFENRITKEKLKTKEKELMEI